MAYVHSSPWQDAANFGGAVGDRLSEALINLPLKKAAMAQQLLQVAAAQKQQQFQNQLGQERINAQKIHYGAEEDHWKNEEKNVGSALEFKKEQAFGNKLQGIVKSAQEDKKLDELVRHYKAMEGIADERVKVAHDRIQNLTNTDKAPHPEFGGLTLGQIIQLHNDDTKFAQLPPEIQTNFMNFLQKNLQSTTNQYTNGLGNALAPQQQQQQGGLPQGIKVTRIQ